MDPWDGWLAMIEQGKRMVNGIQRREPGFFAQKGKSNLPVDAPVAPARSQGLGGEAIPFGKKLNKWRNLEHAATMHVPFDCYFGACQQRMATKSRWQVSAELRANPSPRCVDGKGVDAWKKETGSCLTAVKNRYRRFAYSLTLPRTRQRKRDLVVV